MTAVYRNSSFAGYYTSTTPALPKPSGVASGDVLIAVLTNNDGSRIVNSVPSGWSLLAEIKTTDSPGTGFWVYKKVAGGSEPDTYGFEFNYSFNGRAGIIAYESGTDVSIAGTGSLASAGSTSPYTVNATAITVPDNDSKVVFIGTSRVTTTGGTPAATPPGGYTERVDIGVSWSVHGINISDITQASAGTSGAVAASVAHAGGGAARTVGILVAISPSGGGSTITASGEADCPVITSITVSGESTITTSVGNYSDLPLVVKDQNATVLAGLTGTATSGNTDYATVALLDDTDSLGSTTLRTTGVLQGTTDVTVTFDRIERVLPISITPGATKTIFIFPSTVSMLANGVQPLQASISGDTTSVITWSIVSGGGSIASTAAMTASYTAPAAATTAVIKAEAVDYPGQYALLTITVADTEEYGTVSTTWRLGNIAFANQTLHYRVLASDDSTIVEGAAVTDPTGTFAIKIGDEHIGSRVQVEVDNLDITLALSGKVYGKKVVVVT